VTSTVLEWIRGLSWSDANVRGAAIAVLATLALLIALKLLAFLFRRLRERSRARIEARKIALRVQSWEMVSADGVQQSVRYALGLVHLLAAVVLFDIYMTLVLRLFPATEALSTQYFDLVMAPLVVLWRAIVGYFPKALEILVNTALVLVSLRFLHVFFRALEVGAVKIPGFYRDWADPTYKLIRAMVLVFLFIRIFPILPGADEQAFKAVSLFIGALVTLGSTAAVGNAVAGVVLTYTRAFQIGDWIRVGETTGEVERRTMLVTRLRTAANEQVTIPNGAVLRDHVVNFTPAAKRGRLVLTTTVTIGYDVDWRAVNELLLKAAVATAELSSDPPPDVFQTGLGDFGVSYTLRASTSGPPPLGRIHTALRRNILDEFHRAGVEIMTPSVSALRRAHRRAIPGSESGTSAVDPAQGEKPLDEEDYSA